MYEYSYSCLLIFSTCFVCHFHPFTFSLCFFCDMFLLQTADKMCVGFLSSLCVYIGELRLLTFKCMIERCLLFTVILFCFFFQVGSGIICSFTFILLRIWLAWVKHVLIFNSSRVVINFSLGIYSFLSCHVSVIILLMYIVWLYIASSMQV